MFCFGQAQFSPFLPQIRDPAFVKDIMKKIIALSLLLLSGAVVTPKAEASCYFAIRYVDGWAGPEWYLGSACYTDGGFPVLKTFVPFVPVG